MTETKPHQFEKDFVYVTDLSKYLDGKRVRTGEVLHITHIAGTFENLATSEFVELGYWNGHAYVPIHKDNPENASDYVHWDGNIWLREGQYVYAYFTDVANGEKMKLRAEGKYE
jgi:hypothetical protein